MKPWSDIWKDQEEFNALIRKKPETKEERNAVIQYLVLCMHSELDEVLRAIEWRQHRKVVVPENIPRIKEELIDVFKYWLSMVQIFDMTPADLVTEYWHKSAIVRQRFSEEYVKSLNVPSVIVDIDEVLCDFSNGFLRWLADTELADPYRCNQFLGSRRYVNAELLDVNPQKWLEIKHTFRTSGELRRLNAMPGAQAFLHRCREAGLNIILLTSRNIDKYPNLMSDTVQWLKDQKMEHDFIWWSKDKAERLLSSEVLNHVVFAVDDDVRFVHQMSHIGVYTYWYRPLNDFDTDPTFRRLDKVHLVTTLDQINCERRTA